MSPNTNNVETPNEKTQHETGHDLNRGQWVRNIYLNGRGATIGYGPKVYFEVKQKTYGPRNGNMGPGQVVEVS